MDEAKSLVHMAITALFGVLILAAVLALIAVANLVWRAFSRQNDANRSLREYSKYSAFDGTEVRGQDVIALLHDTQGSPYVIMVDSNNSPKMVAYNQVELPTPINNSIPTTPNAYDEVSAILASLTAGQQTVKIENLVSAINNTGGTGAFDYTDAASSPQYSMVQEFFLERGNIVSGTSGYMKYKSYVLYDGDDSTDIVGILLKEVVDSGGTP